MKKLFKMLLLMPMITFINGCSQVTTPEEPPVDPEPETPEVVDPVPVDVVIISGQSNGVGCTYCKEVKTSMGSSKYQDYMYGFPGIKIAYDCWTKDEYGRFYSQNKSKDDSFVKVMFGQGNSMVTFGPEIGIAEALNENYSNKLFLIKYACGASNLKDDWLKKDSPMYPRLIEYVRKQMKNLEDSGYIPTIKAFCWMQGEGDSYDGYYQEYYENTKEFVTNFRADLKDLAGDKDIPFIDAGINNSRNENGLIWKYYKNVNEAKKQFADESDINFYIDTIAAGMHTNKEPAGDIDPCHYDSESQILLGHLFAENFEQFLEKPE